MENLNFSVFCMFFKIPFFSMLKEFHFWNVFQKCWSDSKGHFLYHAGSNSSKFFRIPYFHFMNFALFSIFLPSYFLIFLIGFFVSTSLKISIFLSFFFFPFLFSCLVSSDFPISLFSYFFLSAETQRVISFLRQMVEHGGFYRTSDQAWVHFERIQFVGACNPPTDPGRKPLSHR